MSEQWKPALGFEFYYEVSDLGRVKRTQTGVVMTLSRKETGYLRVGMSKDGKQRQFAVHRVVVNAFIGLIPDGYEVNHINGVRDDNRLVNLAVVTKSENCKHAFLLFGRKPPAERGSRHYNAKLTETDIPIIFAMIARGDSQTSVAAHFGVRQQAISKVINGKRWGHLGLHPQDDHDNL